MPDFTGTKDLRDYLRMLWRWKLLFLVFLVAAPVAAYLLERGKPNVYQSSALVGVNQTTVNTSLLSYGGSFSTTNVTAIAQLVTTSPVATVAADLLHPPANPGQIVGEVSASGDSATNFLTISAEDRSPTRAAAIANAFAQAISSNLQNAATVQIDNSIKGVGLQLSHLGAHDPARAGLLQQLNQLRAARSTQGSEAAILQPATPSSTPVGPHLRRTIELAALIGLLLGLGAVVLAENADRRLRTPDDLERLADVPLLAMIPTGAFSSSLDTGPADEESFQMLRTSLLQFNPRREHQSVIITSAGEKDGKTTVATRLALAAARAGLTVILVDADLRRAQVAPRLGIETSDGLAEALAGKKQLEELLVPYPLEEPGANRLMVLLAGSPPANPAALISSREMERVVRRLESAADLVVIDTPAALIVSDPLPLMRLASGVVLIARMNRSNRERIRRLRRMVNAAQGNFFGVVATGVTSWGGHGYYGSKYYAGNGTGKSSRRPRKPDKGGAVSAPEDAAVSAPEDGAVSAPEDGAVSAPEDGVVGAPETD